MRVVTIARKPFKGSMTNNVLNHHCGAINIDASRISSYENMSFNTKGQCNEGRWPANLIFQHRQECQRVGKYLIEGYAINTWKDGAKPFGGGAGHEYETQITPDEEVDVWECVEGCPVKSLDDQSGYLKTGKVASHSNEGVHGWKSGQDIDYADGEKGGGASRFFCQVQTERHLWDYLTVLISPPSVYTPKILADPSFGESLKTWVWGHLPDTSVHGIILEGDVSNHVEELLRILIPGGHCCVLSTKDEPTGWRTACRLEEVGFEIRDTIFVADDESDDIHYVSKATTKEKNAGLPSGMQNTHATVKPIRVMQKVLEGLPPNSLVVDPFMGTGTTGIACIRERHNFIGIEQELSSFETAHHRVHYWDGAHTSWLGSQIDSDLGPEEDQEPMSLEDLFS